MIKGSKTKRKKPRAAKTEIQENIPHTQRPVHGRIAGHNEQIPYRDQHHQTDWGIIRHDSVALFIAARKMQDELKYSTHDPKDQAIQSAASRTRQHKGGQCRKNSQYDHCHSDGKNQNFHNKHRLFWINNNSAIKVALLFISVILTGYCKNESNALLNSPSEVKPTNFLREFPFASRRYNSGW